MTLWAKLCAQEAKFKDSLLSDLLLVRFHFVYIPCIGVNV